MIVRVFAIAAVIATVVAACGPVGPTAQPGDTPSVAAPTPTGVPATEAPSSPRVEAPPTAVAATVSRSSAPPGSDPTSTPDLTRPQTPRVETCHATDLAALVGVQGATQALAGDLALTNQGKSPCSLEGYPDVQLVDAKGQALTVKDVAAPDAGPSQRVLLQPGQPVYVRIFWRNWCGTPPTYPLRVRASWTDSGAPASATLMSGDPREQRPLSQTPVCNAPSAGSTVSVYPFHSTP